MKRPAVDKKKHLAVLVGEQLSSVIFVQDYLQLDFDGRTLTLNVWPALLIDGGWFTFGEQGYRDQLCSLITKIVAVVEQSEAVVEVKFTDGSGIHVKLAESTAAEGDRVIFNDTLDGSWSWW